MAVLHLTLKKAAFDVMLTGEKTTEYRKFSKWMKSRLFHKNGEAKQYDLVKFTNGYRKDSPAFYAEYRGCDFERVGWDHDKPYSNGLIVGRVEQGDFKIYLGYVCSRSNIK